MDDILDANEDDFYTILPRSRRFQSFSGYSQICWHKRPRVERFCKCGLRNNLAGPTQRTSEGIKQGLKRKIMRHGSEPTVSQCSEIKDSEKFDFHEDSEKANGEIELVATGKISGNEEIHALKRSFMQNEIVRTNEGWKKFCQQAHLGAVTADKDDGITKLMNELEQSKNNSAVLKTKNEKLTQENQKITRQLEQLEEEKKTATEELKNMCQQLKSGISSKQEELECMERKLKAYQDQIAGMQKELKWMFHYFVPHHNLTLYDFISPYTSPIARESHVEIINQVKELLSLVISPESTYEFYMEQKENSYPVKNVFRGRALLVMLTKDRPGWEADLTALVQLFKTLKYPFEVLLDPTSQCLADRLQNFANDPFNKFVDSTFVFIMGHGGTDEIGREFIQTADQQHFAVREALEAFFNDTECKALSGKPKIFVLQKCRGRPVSDSSNPTASDCIEHDVRIFSQPGDPDITDYVLAYSCQPGKPSQRNTTTGSWFIQEFVKVMLEKAHNRHLVDMLVEVNRRVKNMKGENMETAFPAPEIGLTLPFYLFPRIYLIVNSESSLIQEMEE